MRKGKPNWWMLYALIPSMPVLLVIEGRIPGSPLEHRLMEIGIVLLGFGLIALWVRANEAALIQEEIEEEPWTLEPDPASDAALDPARLPFADGCDVSGAGQQLVEASPTKGRYN